MSFRSVPFMALVAGIIACDGTPTMVDAVDPQEQTFARVAGAMAKAMSSPDVRRFVIAEMRASPWVEHKVLLHDLLTEPDNPLLARASAEANVSADEFGDMVRALPPMDFYLAGRYNRQTWTADGGSVTIVGSHRSSDSGLTEFHAGGDARPFVHDGNGILFALHPAEPRMYRLTRAEVGAGLVIAEPDDDDIGLVIRYVDELGRVAELDIGKSNLTPDQVNEYFGRLGAGVVAASQNQSANSLVAQTFVEYLQIMNLYDGVGASEITIKFWKGKGDGQWTGACCRIEWEYGGVQPGQLLIPEPTRPMRPISEFNGWSPGLGGYSYLIWAFWERDTFPDADDHYGTGWEPAGSGGTPTHDVRLIGPFTGPDICYDAGGVPAVCAAMTFHFTTS